MDEETVERVREFVENMSNEFKIEKAYVFGSRAREDYREESDVDLLIVSEDFKGQPSYKRAKKFYREWEYPPDIELKCYTPEEFKKLKKQVSLAKTASEEGISVA